jgi:cytochrome c oxidase subunit II
MESEHSVLLAHGVQAETIATLSWIMFGGAAVIFLGVAALTAMAHYGGDTWRQGIASGRFIFWGGVMFPLVTLTALLIYGLMLTSARVKASPGDALRIEVSGEQWWWRVRYPDAGFDTANEIAIPVGHDVEILLSSPDVIHSFWVPALAGKVDMIPGLVNRIRLRATIPGVYRGQCAEYCGGPHAMMALYVVALEPTQYEQWLDRQHQQAASEPLTKAGEALFLSSGCNACHTIRGTAASGVIGPDLTHVGSRLSIAAATLPNTAEAFSRWISDNQHIKPNNRMPPFRILSHDDLAALGRYLEGLQ